MTKHTRKDIVDTLIAKIKSDFNVNAELSDKTNLLELGLDSLDIMSYIFYMEEQFNIAIGDDNLEKEDFLIIGETANYILREISNN